MSHAAGQPADGRHAPRKLQLRLDLFHRFRVVQRDQRAQLLACPVVVNEINRCLNAPSGLGANLLVRQRVARIEGLAESEAQHRRCIEDLPRAQAQNGALFDAQEAPRRFGDQHRPPIPGEEQDSVLQVAEDLVQVLL